VSTVSISDGLLPEKRQKLDTSVVTDIKTVPSMTQIHGDNSSYSEKSFIPVFDLETSVTPSDLPEGSDSKCYIML